jgi:hypothetical protein
MLPSDPSETTNAIRMCPALVPVGRATLKDDDPESVAVEST